MPEMNITTPYVHSRVDSNTLTMGKPMPESPMPGSFDFASGIDFQRRGIDSLDSIPGLLKRLQIRSLKRFKGVVKVEPKSASSILRKFANLRRNSQLIGTKQEYLKICRYFCDKKNYWRMCGHFLFYRYRETQFWQNHWSLSQSRQSPRLFLHSYELGPPPLNHRRVCPPPLVL